MECGKAVVITRECWDLEVNFSKSFIFVFFFFFLTCLEIKLLNCYKDMDLVFEMTLNSSQRLMLC